MVEDRVDKLKSITETAQSYAASLDDRVRAGELTREAAYTQLRSVLENMWYAENEYLFVISLEGVVKAHAAKPALVGQSLWDTQDPTGFHFVRAMAEAARDGGGRIYYMWPRAGSDVPERKLSYVAAMPSLESFVGTGVYLDDLEAAFMDLVLRVGHGDCRLDADRRRACLRRATRPGDQPGWLGGPDAPHCRRRPAGCGP